MCATLTTVKVTKQQLFSFLAVHARIPPNEVLLKKQQYALFDDGVAFCRMFNSIFVQRTITPIVTSHQTSSASSRSTRNWKALQRAMTALGIPVDVVPREMYRPNAVDSVGGYSGLVFFYFMHHLAKRRDFSAEFSADVTGSLMTFLQSVDSIRALVLGGAIMLDSLPTELHQYCSTSPHHEDMDADSPASHKQGIKRAEPTVASSNISSVGQHDDDDEGSDIDLPRANGPNDTPHPSNAARSLFHEAASSVPPSPQRYQFESPTIPAAPQEERFFEGEQFTDSAPVPHAASPKLLTMQHVRPPISKTTQYAPTPSSLPAAHSTTTPVLLQANEGLSHDSSGDTTTDVNAAAAQLQRLLLKRHLTSESLEEAQTLLWGILSTYHVTSMRLRRWESQRAELPPSPNVADARCAMLQGEVEELDRANQQLRSLLEQADKELRLQEEQTKLLVASHNAAVARLTDDIVRLRREHEASLQQPQSPRPHHSRQLMDLCATLRALDNTSMELISSNIDETDDDAARIEELLAHRTVLQERAATIAEALHVESTGAGERALKTLSSSTEEALPTSPLITEAMEERIRSVTASRDQLLEELQQLSMEASTWCEEATDLRRQQRDWEAMGRRVEELEADVLRRNNVIEELRLKLSAAMSELDEVRRVSVQRQREHSAIWSVPRPQLESSVGSSSASPAARTPPTAGGHDANYVGLPLSGEGEAAPSVPRFRLSSPRPLESQSPRAPTEARVVDGPYNMSLFPSLHGAVQDSLLLKQPASSAYISLRDLDAIDGILN
ncbi:Hypothetical protein, putative [Bodo saltans]|uniref:Uncharacterized protein n=1 Tax=Bodo saltans TaxID=75058 RepID=A0A0S4JDB5_BODSA|nr:Hypothetical protein, putative [Bodo saltans]|eukprot:CUG89462.1 Hypothetical protein, putative [Bodo saltans]